MKWYMKVVKHDYANFSGRAGRAEYWFFVLWNFIFSFAISIISGLIIGAIIGASGNSGNSSAAFLVEIPLLVYCLAIIVPSLAVTIRRLHDTDRSGWFVLFSFIPIANIVLLVFTILEGTPGPNKYGPNPEAAVAVA
jgi:uncharacterized membrane protein YhaH (DUF805 family)